MMLLNGVPVLPTLNVMKCTKYYTKRKWVSAELGLEQKLYIENNTEEIRMGIIK